jgi:hypothetical protein
MRFAFPHTKRRHLLIHNLYKLGLLETLFYLKIQGFAAMYSYWRIDLAIICLPVE